MLSQQRWEVLGSSGSMRSLCIYIIYLFIYIDEKIWGLLNQGNSTTVNALDDHMYELCM